MDTSKIGFFGLLLAVPISLDWVEVIKSLGITGVFAYYLFVHEPRARRADHARRMEELRELAHQFEENKETK